MKISVIWFMLVPMLSSLSCFADDSCAFYVQHHFVQFNDVNKALASDIDTLLTQWKDDKPLAHKILDDGLRKKRKRKQKLVPCKTRRFIAAEPSSLNGKWSQAGSSVLYMITWLMPQKPNQRRIQFELFVKEHPTARRIWVEGPIDYELPEPTPEAKAQWVQRISQAIIARSLSQGI